MHSSSHVGAGGHFALQILLLNRENMPSPACASGATKLINIKAMIAPLNLETQFMLHLNSSEIDRANT